MKLVGIISNYNGNYGTIITEKKVIVDFEAKDISFNRKININDVVEFRLEERFPDIKIARNVNVISDKSI